MIINTVIHHDLDDGNTQVENILHFLLLFQTSQDEKKDQKTS